jgi:hypothetical protein
MTQAASTAAIDWRKKGVSADTSPEGEVPKQSNSQPVRPVAKELKIED